MARHIKFRNDLNITLIGISNDLLELFLRILSGSDAVGIAGSLRADRAQLIEAFAIHLALDLQTPALIIAHVHMQGVDLILREHIELTLYLIDSEEVTGHVEHHAAEAVFRLICDLCARDRPCGSAD